MITLYEYQLGRLLSCHELNLIAVCSGILVGKTWDMTHAIITVAPRRLFSSRGA